MRDNNNKFPPIEFKSKEDVLFYTDQIKLEETSRTNRSEDYPVLKAVHEQLVFYCCPNVFLSHKYQKDITKYMYCEDTKVSPYEGSYGNTPAIWKEKHFLIKGALSILHKGKRDKIAKKHQEKQKNYGK